MASTTCILGLELGHPLAEVARRGVVAAFECLLFLDQGRHFVLEGVVIARELLDQHPQAAGIENVRLVKLLAQIEEGVVLLLPFLEVLP